MWLFHILCSTEFPARNSVVHLPSSVIRDPTYGQVSTCWSCSFWMSMRHVARHYFGQYSDICDLVSYPPSFSESHLFVCDFHFSLHSDPFQYDPKKDLACICMGDKSNCSVICTLFKITSLGSVMRSPHIFCAFCPVLSLLLLRQLPSIVLLGPHQDLWLCDLLSDGWHEQPLNKVVEALKSNFRQLLTGYLADVA